MLFWMGYDNHVTRAGVSATASAEAATFPASHLLDKRLYRQWRCTSVTGHVDIDFGATARPIKVLAFVAPRIIDTNRRDELQWFQTTDTVRHYLDNTTFGAGALYDSGSIQGGVYPDRGYHAHILPAEVSARKWRISFNVASRTSVGFFDVSFLLAAPIFAPSINYDFGDAFDLIDESLITRTPVTGTPFVSKYERRYQFAASFSAISQAERASWQAFNKHVGTTEPFLLGLNDAAPLGEKVLLATQERTTALSERSPFYSSRDFSAIEYR